MRFKIIEGGILEFKDTYIFNKQIPTKNIEIPEQSAVTGVVVFNSKHQLLPHVSNWLTEALSYGLTPPTTIETYAKNISYFCDYLNEHNVFKKQKLDDALFDIQTHTFKEYFSYLKSSKGLASTTISNRDATFRVFFDDYLCKPRMNGKALREDNPYEEGLINGTPKSKLVEMCTLDEIQALMLCTPHERERLLIQFMYDSGVRRTEVTVITKSQLDKALNSEKHVYSLDENTVSIPSQYKPVFIHGSKGRKRETKDRYTLSSIHTLGRIRRYFSTPEYRKVSKKYGLSAPAFLNSQGNPYTPGSIGKLLHRLSKRAVKKKLIDRYIHPHMLRHGFAGAVLRSPDMGTHSVDKLVLVQHCLGHTFLKTTQVYTRIPYETYGQVVDLNGVALTRADLMERLNIKTKSKKK